LDLEAQHFAGKAKAAADLQLIDAMLPELGSPSWLRPAPRKQHRFGRGIAAARGLARLKH